MPPPAALNVETSNSFKPTPEPVNTLYKSPVIPKNPLAQCPCKEQEK